LLDNEVMDLPHKAETDAVASLVVPTGALRKIEGASASATLRNATAPNVTENNPQPSTGLLLLGLVSLLILGLPLKSKPHG
jgi:hypothetical protein